MRQALPPTPRSCCNRRRSTLGGMAAPTPAKDSWLQKPRIFTRCLFNFNPTSGFHSIPRMPMVVLIESAVYSIPSITESAVVVDAAPLAASGVIVAVSVYK